MIIVLIKEIVWISSHSTCVLIKSDSRFFPSFFLFVSDVWAKRTVLFDINHELVDWFAAVKETQFQVILSCRFYVFFLFCFNLFDWTNRNRRKKNEQTLGLKKTFFLHSFMVVVLKYNDIVEFNTLYFQQFRDKAYQNVNMKTWDPNEKVYEERANTTTWSNTNKNCTNELCTTNQLSVILVSFEIEFVCDREKKKKE